MSKEGPPFAKLYVGIRPQLHLLNKANAGLVYMYLLTRRNLKTGQCDAAATTVAAELRLNIKTIRKAFDVIEASGVARRKKRKGNTDNWSFVVLDIREQESQKGQTDDATLPARRVYPSGGSTHETGRESTRRTGKESTRRTGNEEEPKEESIKKKLASQGRKELSELEASPPEELLRSTLDDQVKDGAHLGVNGDLTLVFKDDGAFLVDGKKIPILFVENDHVVVDGLHTWDRSRIQELLSIRGNRYVAA